MDTTLQLRRALDGDGQSLSWVVSRLQPFVRAQVRHRLGPLARNEDDVEDLVHEVWLVTLARLGDLRPRDGHATPALVAFLGTTAVQLTNNFLRKAIHRRERGAGEVDGEREGRLARLADETRGVPTRVVDSETHDVIREVLDGMPPGKREVLVLRLVEQRSIAEIARDQGIEPNTVSVRYRRALEELRARLPRGLFAEIVTLTRRGGSS